MYDPTRSLEIRDFKGLDGCTVVFIPSYRPYLCYFGGVDKLKSLNEQTAQAILDARALYPDASLADLYGETTMPSELRKAHQNNDKAVMLAYGFSVRDMTERE